jgi:hypothetical protein
MLHLILGGAALQCCDNRFVCTAALATEVKLYVARDYFSSLLD